MRILPMAELLLLTRSELLNLQAHMTGALATIPTHSPDYAVAMINLRNVGDILSRSSPRHLPRHMPDLSGPR
ncbi:MAG: hypothetical protein AB7U61_09105 [Methylocystis sp.]